MELKKACQKDTQGDDDNTSSPFEIPTTWENTGICGGGATFYPSVSPHDDNQYFISNWICYFTKFRNRIPTTRQIPI